MRRILGFHLSLGRVKNVPLSLSSRECGRNYNHGKENCWKEILWKAVALSIPTYTMNSFLIPSSLCNELEEMMSRFWWGQKGNER